MRPSGTKSLRLRNPPDFPNPRSVQKFKPHLLSTCARRIACCDNSSKSKGLGWKALPSIATLVSPATLLAWHQKLIAQKIPSAHGSAPPLHVLWSWVWLLSRLSHARYCQQQPVATAGPAFLELPSIHTSRPSLSGVIQPNFTLIQSSDYDVMQISIVFVLQCNDQSPALGNLAG